MTFNRRPRGAQNKYSNTRCIVTPSLAILTAADLAHGKIARTKSDISFQSLREAKRYVYLRQLEQLGHIENLRTQVPFVLMTTTPAGLQVAVAKYLADFVYLRVHPDGVKIEHIEDSKGMKTETYMLKKKWVEAQYGVKIEEV